MNERSQRILDRLNRWQRAWVILDQALTEKPLEQILQQIHHQPKSLAEWMERGSLYHLADGGYSRVSLVEDTGKLALESESINKPKANWKLSAQERREVEALIDIQYHDMWKAELGVSPKEVED